MTTSSAAIQHYADIHRAAMRFAVISFGTRPEAITAQHLADRAAHPTVADARRFDHPAAPELVSQWSGHPVSECREVLAHLCFGVSEHSHA